MHKIMDIYHRLYEAYGPQSWWPASSDLEMMLGAILVQNTAWGNVEKAIQNLPLNCRELSLMGTEALEEAIRPAGSFRRKAQSIQGLVKYLLSIEEDVSRITGDALLEIHGIGKETRDCILLYAKQEPVFVVDTYLKRMLEKMKLAKFKDYDDYQAYMEEHSERSVEIYQEYHALIVEYGKRKKTDVDPLLDYVEPVFPISEKSLDLVKRDEVMKRLVDYYGLIQRPVMRNLFDSITYTIIGQLVSVKAAQSIQNRFDALYQWPEDVAKVDVETLKQVGLTKNKANAIHKIANMFVSGELRDDMFDEMDDEAVVKQIVALPGIGDWSARMILIHGLNRENITSYDDVAIRRGVCMAYDLESIDRDAFNELLQTFSPYQTVASIYFWSLSKESKDIKKTILGEPF